MNSVHGNPAIVCAVKLFSCLRFHDFDLPPVKAVKKILTFNKLPIIIFLLFSQFDNVESCLGVLRQNQVGGLETITANDICSGRLKAVLSLFFSLSRYKQASKLKTPSRSPQTFVHHPQIHQQPAQHLNTSSDMIKER